MNTFILKKIVSNLVHIVPGAFILMLLCVLLLRWMPRTARIGLVVVPVLLLAFSSPPVSNVMVRSYENHFPVLQSLPGDTALILVLGYGHHWTPERPVNSVLMGGALSRVTEAARLWQTNPEAHMMVSGAAFRSPVPHAKVVGDMAQTLGVNASRLLYADQTLDTDDEINTAVQWMQQHAAPQDRLVVVSSGIHLPRAAQLIDDRVRYTMAPTDFRVLDAPWWRFHAMHLRDVDFVVHEAVGMVWNSLVR